MTHIIKKVKDLLKKEPKFLKIRGAKKVIFVGDTHGDLEASQKIIRDYLKPGNKIVFLGDYVDRGTYSKENLDFVLRAKADFPKQIALLQGNHEGHKYLQFQIADFWEGLDKPSYDLYSSLVEQLTLAVSVKNILATHGALPGVKKLEDINNIVPGSKEWVNILWGDFSEKVDGSSINPYNGRPIFGQKYFNSRMEKFDKQILIRSHQHFAPTLMFDDKCVTLYTSSAYNRERTIAIFDLEKKINYGSDLEIKTI